MQLFSAKSSLSEYFVWQKCPVLPFVLCKTGHFDFNLENSKPLCETKNFAQRLYPDAYSKLRPSGPSLSLKAFWLCRYSRATFTISGSKGIERITWILSDSRYLLELFTIKQRALKDFGIQNAPLLFLNFITVKPIRQSVPNLVFVPFIFLRKYRIEKIKHFRKILSCQKVPISFCSS